MHCLNRRKNFYTLIVFSLTVFFLTGCEKVNNKQEIIISLTDVFKKNQIQLLNGVEPPQGSLKFSPNGKYLVVASRNESKIRLIATDTQKVLYQWDAGIGKFRTAIFSADNQYLYIGEHSPDGYVYCISLPTGKKVWQYSLGKEIGMNLAKKSYPIVNQISLDRKGNLYFVGGRVEIKKAKTYDYHFRAYALNANTGRLLWKFPAKESLDVSSYAINVDQQGETVVLNTNTYNNAEKKKYPPGKAYVLNGQTGELKWSHHFPLLPIFQQTSAWVKTNISPDGQYIAAFSRDGHAYLLDQKGKVLWKRAIIEPKMVGNALLYASGMRCYFLQNRIIFSTSPTASLNMGKENLPLEHPNCNTVFAYDLQGNLMWKWKSEGLLTEQRFTDDEKYMICSVGGNRETKNLSVHAVYILKISPQKVDIVEKYQPKSRGMMLLADLSPNGQYLAALESPAPAFLTDGITPVGKDQLHIWTRKE